MNDLTLVIPAKEEAECLPQVLNEILEVSGDLKIIICLASDDLRTIESIKNYKVDILYQKNKGYGNAIIEGINKVDTKFFCIFNADGSFNPLELKNMHGSIINKNCDFIFASRYLKGSSTEDDTYITALGNFIFTLIGKFFFKLPISDILYTFMMGKTEIFKKMYFTSQDFRLCVEMPIKLNANNFVIKDCTSHERPRLAGKKKPNALKDGLLILTEMIKLYFYNSNDKKK